MSHIKPFFSQNFTEWCATHGTQRFYQPSTVQLPAGVTPNEFGWLDVPATTEIVIPLVEVRPNETRNLYWFYEKIVTTSDQPLRMSLEGNFSYDPVTDSFPADAWKTTTGYVITNAKDHQFVGSGGAMITTKGGEALRLRVFPTTGNAGDFYFKFIAFDVPE